MDGGAEVVFKVVEVDEVQLVCANLLHAEVRHRVHVEQLVPVIAALDVHAALRVLLLRPQSVEGRYVLDELSLGGAVAAALVRALELGPRAVAGVPVQRAQVGIRWGLRVGGYTSWGLHCMCGNYVHTQVGLSTHSLRTA